MLEQITYWRAMALNLLFALQALFIGTTSWDFYLTLISQSARSHIFASLPIDIVGFIIFPWIIGIFILSITLVVFMFNKEYRFTAEWINFEYIGMLVLYSVLFVLSIFTPIIPVPIVLNYLVNIVWLWILICIRRSVRRNLIAEIDADVAK